MYLGEVVKTTRPFKRELWADWYIKFKATDDGVFIIRTDNVVKQLSGADILADDWVYKEMWYEGNFLRKYPNGVLCRVWNNKKEYPTIRVIYNYNPESNYPFISDDNSYKQAEPILTYESPYIFKKEELC